MTISSGASGIKPGVCTSTTLPASPYEGMLIYETDTNKLKVWSGSSWIEIIDIDTPPAMQLLRTQVITVQASPNIDTVFDSTFDNYMVLFKGTSSDGGNTFRLRLRTATTRTESNYVYSQQTIASGTSNFSLQTAQPFWRVGANDTGAHHSLQFTLLDPNKASPTHIISNFVRNNGSAMEAIWGAQTDSTQFTGFNFEVGSGTMSGTIRVYGLRN